MLIHLQKLNNMINKLDEKIAEQFGLDFDELLDDFYDDSNSSHRRYSSFYKQSIVEISEEHYPHIDKQLYGFWETNEYTLHRVILKEKTIIQKYWEKV